MSSFVTEKLEEALEETKDLLLPFDLGTWLRLIVIMLFVGGGGFNFPTSFPTGSGGDYSGTGDYSQSYSQEVPTSNTGDLISAQFSDLGHMTGLAAGSSSAGSMAMVVVLVLFALGFGLFWMYLSSVFEFIFYQSLLDKDVSIRGNFRKHYGNGLRYFGFRLGFMLIILGMIGGIIAAIFLSPILGILGILPAIIFFIGMAIFAALVHDFVLIKMIESGEGLIASWKEIWPDIRENAADVLLYFIIKMVVALALGIAIVIVALIFVIPAVLVLVIGGTNLLTGILFALLLLLTVAAVLTVKVPVQTFLYYYTILIYHEITS